MTAEIQFQNLIHACILLLFTLAQSAFLINNNKLSIQLQQTINSITLQLSIQ